MNILAKKLESELPSHFLHVIVIIIFYFIFFETKNHYSELFCFQNLIDKVFEVVSVCEENIQQELIACIADLSTDENHYAVATQLR